MKMTNLYLVERSLLKMEYQIEVDPEIAAKARNAIERMLAV